MPVRYRGAMPNVGIWEILIVLLVLLLIFGPKRLPGMGRSLGRGVREFKESVTDQTRELREAAAITPDEFKDSLNPLAASPEPASPAPAEASPASTPAAPAERDH